MYDYGRPLTDPAKFYYLMNEWFPYPRERFMNMITDRSNVLPLVALVASTMRASGCPPRTSGPSLLGPLRTSHWLISVWRIMSSGSAGAGSLSSVVAGAGCSALLSLLCKKYPICVFVISTCVVSLMSFLSL